MKLYKTVYTVTVLSTDERPVDLEHALHEADSGGYSQATNVSSTKINKDEFTQLCIDQGTDISFFFGE